MRRSLVSLLLLIVAAPAALGDDGPPPWVDAMRNVHHRYSGRCGTFAMFGDGMTESYTFFGSIAWERRTMTGPGQAAYDRVHQYMLNESWNWKGEKFGCSGNKSSDWACEHIDQWLRDLDPEAAVLMFCEVDCPKLTVEQHEANLRRLVGKCLANGTVVILTSQPPRHGLLDKSKACADVERKIAAEFKLPLVDLQAEILKRRPDDWDGASDKWKNRPAGADIETMTDWEGIHLTYPKRFQGDFTENGLNNCGYGLRTYMTLMMYDDLIGKVLSEHKKVETKQ